MGRRRFQPAALFFIGRRNREVAMPEMNLAPKLIDVAAVCALTSLSVSRVYALVQEGELRRVKLGRKTVFVEAEIETWIRSKIEASPLRQPKAA